MPRDTVRPCVGLPARAITCGVPARGGRCETHRRMVEAERHNKAYDDPAWRRLSRSTITAHVKRFGWVCPGYKVASHPSRDLTADHPIGLAQGGSLLGQQPEVLCSSCNTRKRNDRRRAA